MGTYSLIPGLLNNRQDPLRLGVTGKEAVVSTLVTANNVDFDAAGTCSLRKGRTLKSAASAPHSLWVHPSNSALAFFVEGGWLKKLNTDYSSTAIGTLSANANASFLAVNGEVIVSNGTDIGWVSSAFEAFSPLLGIFEAVMPAGQYLGFSKGCLLVASGDTVYVSKPWNVERRDTRLSEFPVGGYLRMLGVVDDGWYGATDKGVFFVSGTSVDDFALRYISKYAPADGCFLADFEQVGTAQMPVVFWASHEGFCVGRAGGNYQNFWQSQVVLPDGGKGKYFKVMDNGTERHIAVICNPVTIGAYEAPTLTVETITIT
jgi:hypothetical protein